MKEICNARIRSVFLGIEDHGCLTAVVQLEGRAWTQGFGLYNFGSQEKVSPAQAQNLAAFILGLLRVVGVSEWAGLVGEVVRIERDYGKVYRIGHAVEEKWFDPAEVFAD